MDSFSFCAGIDGNVETGVFPYQLHICKDDTHKIMYITYKTINGFYIPNILSNYVLLSFR